MDKTEEPTEQTEKKQETEQTRTTEKDLEKKSANSREDTSEHFELSNKNKTKTRDASKKPSGV